MCGAVRYECTADPGNASYCHCDDCRKATGASFTTNVFVKADDLVILKGTPKQFQHKADSGNVMTKEFCGNCGSQLFGYGSGSPGVKHVKVGTIDDASNIRPEINVFTSKKLPFTILSDETENFERMRPR